MLWYWCESQRQNNFFQPLRILSVTFVKRWLLKCIKTHVWSTYECKVIRLELCVTLFYNVPRDQATLTESDDIERSLVVNWVGFDFLTCILSLGENVHLFGIVFTIADWNTFCVETWNWWELCNNSCWFCGIARCADAVDHCDWVWVLSHYLKDY